MAKKHRTTDIEKTWRKLQKDKYRVDCCNGECNWTGYSTDCVSMKHDNELLCPECLEKVKK